MGNHRADRRGHSRRPSASPAPAAPATTQQYAGRRIAVRPVDVPATPAQVPVPATPAQVPVATTQAGPTASEVGKRRAVKHAGSRGPLFRGLPSVPVLAGVAALTIAVGGAVSAPGAATLASAGDAPPSYIATQANALGGDDGVASVSLTDRTPTVSRESRRDALERASDSKLVEAAEQQARQRNAALGQLAQLAEQQADKIALNQWVLPLDSYRLTATFGEVGLWASSHTGLDFAADSGAPIKAIANGVITETGYDGAYGNKTVLTLDDGTEIWFCHQTTFEAETGDVVRAGEVIGTVGSTGNSTGPHLHLEVRPGGGDPVDPNAALTVHGITP